MPELRGQLLRLYTDMWGAEGVTLRLSRPGLARLYAKGHMLPRAIQEFRGVIEELPERFDARVGLAEALWRDGQMDAAAETCEEILAHHDDVLKANLLLGYIRLDHNDKRGELYWRRAQQLDPYQQVARSLFDTLPQVAEPDLAIAAWDESAWLAERKRAEEQQRAKQQPAMAAVAPAAAALQDEGFDDFLAEELADPTPAAAKSSSAPDPADDFLASLLADTPPLPPDLGGDLDSSSGVTPFSLDEIAPAAQPSKPAENPAPFTLDDLGLAPETPAPAQSAEPEPEPFSLSDLGLSPDEIAQMEPGEAAQPASDEPALEPFSLGDLGLSPDE
ncbi:hypothetical protein CJ255_03535, partial [Candidatus Viridilinea mediisalina]